MITTWPIFSHKPYVKRSGQDQALETADLVNDLYHVLTSQIALPRFYSARVRGFRNEMEFERAIAGSETLDAGQFLFTKRDIGGGKPGNNIVYVTVTTDKPERYSEFYGMIRGMPEVRKLFLVHVEDLDRWTETQIQIKEDGRNVRTTIARPAFVPYEYREGQWHETNMDAINDLFEFRKVRVCKSKEREVFDYMNDYDVKEIAKIYGNRFFLDVNLIGRNKGMIDFDHVIKRGDSYVAVETKEKTPMTDPKSFGWDSRRFAWYMYLRHAIGLDCTYVLREVDTLEDRNFVGWKAISLDDFCRHASWLMERQGGGGGGTISAPYEAFGDLDRVTG